MNPIYDDKPAGEDHRFDLLVDGELGESDRRELLSRLDDEPGGWRRCALAFLEARAWKEGFGSMLHRPAERPPAEPVGRRPWFGGRGTTLLAMAASFLVALFLGTLIEGLRHSAQPAGAPTLEVAGGQGVEQPAPEMLPPESPPGEIRRPPDGPSRSTAWRMVTDSEPLRLPVIERGRIDAQWVKNLPSPMPLDLLRELEENGHQIQRRRGLLPYRMPDGTRLVVPVDEYEVHYVGRPAL